MKNLKQLFESDLLTEESKQVLQEAFDKALEAKEVEVEAKYAEKLNEEKSAMTSLVIEMVEEAVADELTKISEEITEARTLEVRYAEKLEEFKTKYDEKLQEQMQALVAETVKEELDELQEDIDYAKKHQFVMSMFESFQDVYSKTFGTGDVDAYDQLKEAQEELEQLKREKVLNSLLEGLEGSKRNIAETILEGTATDKLEARFESIRPVLLKEAVQEEKEETLNESESKSDEVKGKVVIEEGVDPEDQKVSSIDAKLQERLERSLKFARR